MRSLERKLLRDLTRLKVQVLTIALVVACGVASYVAIEGTHACLLAARDAYYERSQFPDVFAHLKSAPDSLRARIEAVSGIAIAETRLVSSVSLPLTGLREPAIGQLIGLPASGQPRLSLLTLQKGRLPEAGQGAEVVVLAAFARAHGLELGNRIPVVMAGVRVEARVVGIALSPEYVFAIGPGEMMPDPRRFGVLFMDARVVAVAFGMQGAFNDVIVRLQPGASERAVVASLDRMLAPFGGLGAYGRNRQVSSNALRGEIAQLEMLTRLMPSILLGVAAFLINVVLRRLVQLQRPQIAALKAIGYRASAVGLHYLELVTAIVLGGWLLGLGFGAFVGDAMTDLYLRFFSFPMLAYELRPRVASTAMAISGLSALVGALSAVRSVMRLPAAEAMRPEQPASYAAGLASRVRGALRLGTAATMVLRDLERRPLRALLSALGIAMGLAVLISGRFSLDTVDWLERVQFEQAQREDVSVTFRRPAARAALREVAHLPGVLGSEGLRGVAVRYRSGHHVRESMLLGHPDQPELRRVLDAEGRLAPLPEQGVLISKALARALELEVGQPLAVELLEGARRTVSVQVEGLVDESIGLFGHMRAQPLSRLLGDDERVTQALLRVDPLRYDALLLALRARPEVLTVTRRASIAQSFREQTGGQMRVTTLILTLFAAIVAGGVVYNNARIALSTRSRDLASLRVLGLRRREVSAILLGELCVHVLLALPPGIYVGRLLCRAFMSGADPEAFRFPLIVSARTYAFAISVTLLASLASALLVRRRLDRLDLIGVLKSRE